MTLNGDSKEIKHHETHDFSRPTENGPNNGFVFHTKVLALVLLCLFTFFLSLKVQDMIFESDDITFNDAFISTPKVLMLEMTAATKGLFVYKSHVIFLTPFTFIILYRSSRRHHQPFCKR